MASDLKDELVETGNQIDEAESRLAELVNSARVLRDQIKSLRVRERGIREDINSGQSRLPLITKITDTSYGDDGKQRGVVYDANPRPCR